jgi:hypothetical protein
MYRGGVVRVPAGGPAGHDEVQPRPPLRLTHPGPGPGEHSLFLRPCIAYEYQDVDDDNLSHLTRTQPGGAPRFDC